MKKRNLLLLVCILLAVALVMVSCGNKDKGDETPHQHSFATTYSSDATGHWYAATCEHTDAKLSFAAHADSDKDGNCDVCTYVTCEHTYDTSVWVSDETNHWHAATCGCNVISDSAAHADVDLNGKCDTCEYITCEHSFADEYTKDENGHWLEYTCNCVLEPEVFPHADDDKDGNCDACAYVLCAHNPEADWSYDINSHWHASDCDCDVKLDEAGHTYEDGSITCSVCGYVCTHDLKDEWSADEDGHWHDAICEHEIDVTVEAHIDDNKDGVCDVCEYEDPNHTHTWAIGSNKHQHYSYTTCEHIVVKNFVNHTDDDNDGKCDTCSACMDDLAEVIESVTSDEAAGKINGGFTYNAELITFVYENGTISCEDIFWQGALTLTPEVAIDKTEITVADLAGNWSGIIESEWGDSYIYTVVINSDGTGTLSYDDGYVYNYEIRSITVIDSNVTLEVVEPVAITTYTFYEAFTYYVSYGTKYYLTSYLKDGVPTLFKVSEDEWGTNYDSYATDVEELKGPHIGIMYDYISAFGVESFISALYECAISEEQVIFNLVENYDEENGVLYFSFARLNEDEWMGNSVQVYTATLNIVDGAIASAVVTANEYMSDSYYADAENGVFIPYADATPTMSYYIVINQTIGARENEENSYKPEDILIFDLKLYNQATDEEIKEGDVIEIGVGQENALCIVLSAADEEKASLNAISFAIYDSLGFETWDAFADSWVYPYIVYSSNKTGDYTVVVSSAASSAITFTARFTAKAPTVLHGAVVVDGTKSKTDEVTTYANVAVTLGVIAGAAESCQTTAAVTAGNPDAVNLIPVGENWVVRATEVGTYTITFTSTMNTVSTFMTLIVTEAPSAADILVGTYEFNGQGEEISVTFTPESEGAANGTVVIAFDNNSYLEPVEFNETATYSYEDGVITLTHVEGDGLDLVFAIEITEDYKVNLIVYLNPDFAADFVLDKVNN